MAQIYDSLKALITPEMISGAAVLLEENATNVSKAVSSTISGLLGVMLKKGNTQQTKNILEEAGNLNIASDISNIFIENPTQNQQNIGDNFLQHLLGDKAEDFTAPIAEHSKISKVATNRIISMVAPVVAGYLGNKLVKDKWSMTQLMDEISKSKDHFAKHIPAGLVKAFGLSSILNHNNMSNDKNNKTKKNRSWIVWVVIILLLLLLLFWWRSCRNSRNAEYIEIEKVTVIDSTVNRSANMRSKTVLTLPNGAKLNAYKGGIEDEVIKFLQSNEYKNATQKDLNEKWFVFDDIRFEFNSPTQLMSGSRDQLNNIIEILKYFNTAKVQIIGFADKVGTEEVNLEMSKERAKTIETMMENGGIGSQIVKIDGYGEEYAKHSVKETDYQRSPDRDIALRFVK